jgi:hypothetical protein
LLRMERISTWGLVRMPTSMPRVSLPSISMTWPYWLASRSVLKRSSEGRSSASTTAWMSAPTSWMTWAVMRVLVSSTGSVASSSHPVQLLRPVATISMPVSACSTSKLPRLARSQAHFGVGVR